MQYYGVKSKTKFILQSHLIDSVGLNVLTQLQSIYICDNGVLQEMRRLEGSLVLELGQLG